MPVVSVRIPQLGEGLQEALLIEFLKKPGDRVKRDEPLYVMETDKATTDVESPYEGRLVEWTVEPGSVLGIGSEIGKMEVAEGVKEMAAGHGLEPANQQGATAASTEKAESPAGGAAVATAPPRPRSAVQIPPRTRKYLKEKGLLDVADQIPASGSRLMPEDVDRYLAQQPTRGGAAAAVDDRAAAAVDGNYQLVPLSTTQQTLNFRLVRGAQVCVPVTVMTNIDWTAIDRARNEVRQSGGPTAFSMSLYCVVQALKQHDKFRSVLTPDGKSLKVFKHVNLGIAVALPGDEMVTAVVRNADDMSQNQFFDAVNQQIETARGGKDQADESTTITVSNIGKAGMRWGIPAIVAPAVATMAIGESFSQPVPNGDSIRFVTTVSATLSFDHRIVNGVGAANFMNDVKSAIERFMLK